MIMAHSRESGQGLVEYALIMIFVAVVAVVIVTVLGPGIQQFYTNTVGLLRNTTGNYTAADLQAKVNSCVGDATAKATLTSDISGSDIASAVNYALSETGKKIDASCAADIVGIGNRILSG
jgi:Flp pilus assembly pilin Flp